MSNSISLNEMIKAMDEGKIFSIEFDTCDLKRDTGGERIRIDRAKKCGLPYHCQDNEMRGIVNQDGGDPVGVHLRLVFKFNDLTVYW